MKKWLFWLFFGTVVLSLLVSCSSSEPILIGVAVELSGSRGKIGVAIRNGAQLAVDQINSEGGINGREIKLIILDDKGNADTALQVDQELIDLGVIAILGHVTSQQTEAVYQLVNEAGVILMGATSSSPKFTGLEDNFFRVMPDNQAFGRSLGTAIGTTYNISRLVSVLDLDNEAFSVSLWENAKEAFEQTGGEVVSEITFSSQSADLDQLMEAVAEIDPEAVLFISSGTDTALMAQYARQKGVESQFFSSTWAQTDQLISKGGASVEGMILSAVFNPNSQNPAYLEFSASYLDKFNTEPVLGSTHAYESMMVLAEGLRKTNGGLEGLAEALSGIRDFAGIQGVFSFDQYGDVVRESYFMMVDDREFVIVDLVSSEDAAGQ